MSARILIVDDNRELAEDLAEVLELEGFEAVVMDDPQRVVREAATLRFDAALLDVRMPGIDGLVLLRHLAEHSPSAVYLLMTGHTREARIASSDARGHRVLAKPFGPDVLIAALRDSGVSPDHRT